jgi:hypothetical protein
MFPLLISPFPRAAGAAWFSVLLALLLANSSNGAIPASTTTTNNGGGMRRLRRASAVQIPDLTPPAATATAGNNNIITQHKFVINDATGFAQIEDELEEFFFDEVFRRLDASLSYPMMSMSYDFGGGGHHRGESSSGDGDHSASGGSSSTGGNDSSSSSSGSEGNNMAGSGSGSNSMTGSDGADNAAGGGGGDGTAGGGGGGDNVTGNEGDSSAGDSTASGGGDNMAGNGGGDDMAGSGTDGMAGGSGGDNNMVTGGGSSASPVEQKCGMSSESRSEALMSIVSTVSDPSLLSNPDSSRYQAMKWLENDDGAMLCPGNPQRVIQRYIAAMIYFQFNGAGWNNCRADGTSSCFQEDSTSVPAIPFLDASNECLWFGLSCANTPKEVLPSQRDLLAPDEYSPIVTVDISDNDLQGDLFEELFGLTELQELTLDGNKGITGSIPEAIGQLTQLIAVDIDDNSLTGGLPSSLFTLTTLEAIDLNNNALTGTISNDIGNLKDLVVVQLDNNNFRGMMPTNGLLELERLGEFFFCCRS